MAVPTARRTFPWYEPQQWDRAMLRYFKELIALRHAHPVLRHGQFYQLAAEGGCFAFARQLNEEALVIVLNAGTEAHTLALPVGAYFADGHRFQRLFGEGEASPVENGQAEVQVPGRTGVVLA